MCVRVNVCVCVCVCAPSTAGDLRAYMHVCKYVYVCMCMNTYARVQMSVSV